MNLRSLQLRLFSSKQARPEQPWAESILKHWANWMSSNACLHCGDEGPQLSDTTLCHSCGQTLWSMPRCSRCDERCHSSEKAKSRCSKCKKQTLKHEQSMSLGPYRGWLRDALLGVKYRHDPVCLYYLQRLAMNFPPPRGRPFLYTYVPSHPKRCRQRGTREQHLPHLLKRYLKHHHIGLTPLLKKSSYENAQANRSGEERRNAKDLQFEIIRPIPSGTHVWIFDDVITTGATLKSACHQLKWAGAQTVTTLSFAKSSWEPFSLPTTKAPSIIDS